MRDISLTFDEVGHHFQIWILRHRIFPVGDDGKGSEVMSQLLPCMVMCKISASEWPYHVCIGIGTVARSVGLLFGQTKQREHTHI